MNFSVISSTGAPIHSTDRLSTARAIRRDYPGARLVIDLATQRDPWADIRKRS